MGTRSQWCCLAAVFAWGAAAQAASPDEISALINRHVEARWQQERVEPAPRCSDAEFLRRAWLDLAGTIPPIGVVREFIEDESPDKRRQAVEQLLRSPLHVERFAQQWMQLLVPEAESDYQLAYVGEELRSWLRRKALDNTPYDELARQVLTVPLSSRGNRGAMTYYSTSPDPRPTAYYAAKETAPENLAASTARLFLGLRVDCAQCHDHPFSDWKREQFWSYAAFFKGLTRRRGPASLIDLFADRPVGEVSIAIPDTDLDVPARFLNGASPELQSQRPRDAVADWIVSADNPYFARAMVNRTWAELLGRGIVDPVDDMDAANPPSHPQLLDELAEAFAADFDVQALTAGIMLSQPYQRTSVRTHATQDDPALFARFHARRLDARQVHASMVQALGFPRPAFNVGQSFDANQLQFRQYFTSSQPPLERASSVQQVLLMMNGQMVRQGAGAKSQVIRALLDTPGLGQSDHIDGVFLMTLSRMPGDEERQRIADHLNNSEKREQALSDAIWALVNSAEFIVNH